MSLPQELVLPLALFVAYLIGSVPFAVISSRLFGLADPRSFCIQKTLQEIAHGAPVDQHLMFAGHAAYRFKQDPFYSNNFTPTVKQLVDRILTGD